MTYPTNAEIDAAVPPAGTPHRGLTNAVLKKLAAGPSISDIDGVTAIGQALLQATDAEYAREALNAAADNHRHDNATQTANGFMSSQDKTKLDGIQTGAQVNASWGSITGQPAVVAAGATAQAARDSIGAGTSNLQLGATNDTAAPGNHRHPNATSTTDGFMSKEDKVALADAALKSKQNTFTDTTASTSTTTGAAVFAGGIGVQGAVHSGATPNWLAVNTQVAPMVFIRDMYRQQVEAASGGMQTVLYTEKGQPSIMNVIPAFNLEDIDPSLGVGIHPMFIVGGVTKRERFIGAYQGSVINGELLSLPGVDPAVSRNFDSFVAVARANGNGWGLMTNADWAGVALWCNKNGFMPRGNTNYGRSSDATYEVGRRAGGGSPGVATGAGRTLTGSGPASWRHDNSPNGIADLCGNIWEWAPGMRLVDGEIHVIADNDAALTATDFGTSSSAWRAIDGATGELVAPGHANAVKYAASGTENYTLVRALGLSFEGITNPGAVPVAEAALQMLKRYGLFPLANTGLGGDAIWHDLTGERLLIRGGDWVNGAAAGVFALNLFHPRSNAGTSFGSRPAFVL